MPTKPDNWVDMVAREALSWEHTPYDPHGRVKGVGVDCGWLLWKCYDPIFGPLPLPPAEYAVDWALHTEEQKYLDFVMPHVREALAPVAGGFSLFHVGRAYSHAAILLPNGNYIHAWGRVRAGRVMQTAPRLMEYLSMKSGHPTKHFEPK